MSTACKGKISYKPHLSWPHVQLQITNSKPTQWYFLKIFVCLFCNALSEHLKNFFGLLLIIIISDFWGAFGECLYVNVFLCLFLFFFVFVFFILLCLFVFERKIEKSCGVE